MKPRQKNGRDSRSRETEVGEKTAATDYIYRVLQTIQMKLILLCVWAEPAVLGSTKMKFE